MSSPEPDWGQAVRNLGQAVTGRHTRAGQRRKPGCLDAILLVVGTAVTLTFAIAEAVRVVAS